MKICKTCFTKAAVACALLCGCTVTDGTKATVPAKAAPKPGQFPELTAFLAEEQAARDGSPQQQIDFAKKWVGKRVSFSGLISDQWTDTHSRMVRVVPSRDRYARHLTVFFLPDEFPPMRMSDSAIVFTCVITSFNPLGCIGESEKRYATAHPHGPEPR
jgi:hypothetical protein